MSYKERSAKKNKVPFIISDRIYIGDTHTYIESTGDGYYTICTENSKIGVDSEGNIDISGASSIKFNSQNIDFNELPDRYVRPSGLAWNTVATHSKIVAALPIRIKGQKVYIPCLDVSIEG